MACIPSRVEPPNDRRPQIRPGGRVHQSVLSNLDVESKPRSRVRVGAADPIAIVVSQRCLEGTELEGSDAARPGVTAHRRATRDPESQAAKRSFELRGGGAGGAGDACSRQRIEPERVPD